MVQMVPMVLTVDQRSSRSRADLVPEQWWSYSALATLRAFDRTAGDEIQGIVDDPEVAVAVLSLLLRGGDWNIGLGIGPVEEPLPTEARAGRGSAFLHAREAVTRAKQVRRTSALSVTTATVPSSWRPCCGSGQPAGAPHRAWLGGGRARRVRLVPCRDRCAARRQPVRGESTRAGRRRGRGATRRAAGRQPADRGSRREQRFRDVGRWPCSCWPS